MNVNKNLDWLFYNLITVYNFESQLTWNIIQHIKNILNIIVYKDFSLEQGLFWPRDLIMYKYKIFSLIFHDTGIA